MSHTFQTATPEILDAWQRGQRKVVQPVSDAEILRRIRILADLLDNRFTIPGTNYRVGLDALIGLIPGIGDIATTALSGYLVYLAHQLNVPKTLIARMLMNVAIDMAAGSIPVLGDLADVAFRANAKNVRLLEAYLSSRGR